jgi:hypothetical protein
MANFGLGPQLDNSKFDRNFSILFFLKFFEKCLGVAGLSDVATRLLHDTICFDCVIATT